jgi:hypothetical protein
MSIAIFSISCILVLFAWSSLSFLQLAFDEFGLLELCRLTLFKFRIKVLKTKRKPNSPPSWVIDPYTSICNMKLGNRKVVVSIINKVHIFVGTYQIYSMSTWNSN